MVRKWLIDNEKFINYRSLEREINAPRGIIQKWIKYDFKMPEKWIDKLHPLIKRITSKV